MPLPLILGFPILTCDGRTRYFHFKQTRRGVGVSIIGADCLLKFLLRENSIMKVFKPVVGRFPPSLHILLLGLIFLTGVNSVQAQENVKKKPARSADQVWSGSGGACGCHSGCLAFERCA
jgi:hypothetical protein